MRNSFYQKIYTYLKYAVYLWHPFHRTAYLLATPTHDNIGDIAIAVAEIEFLKKCGYTKIVNIPISELWNSYACICKLLPKKAVVCFQGGGNFGDVYLDEELRRAVFPLLKNHKIIIFPQTMFFSETEKGKAYKESSVEYYNKSNIVLCAREKYSYDLMKELYPNSNIIFVPDIVLSINPHYYNSRREGILLCLRSDSEKKVTDEETFSLKNVLQKTGLDISETSMIYKHQISVPEWESVVDEKMQEFSKAKLVVTDRLHGMVFAALTGTPCVVMGNNHHKVVGVYQWLKHLNYIRYAENVDEAACMADELLSYDKCEFNFDASRFKPLEKVLTGND